MLVGRYRNAIRLPVAVGVLARRLITRWLG